MRGDVRNSIQPTTVQPSETLSMQAHSSHVQSQPHSSPSPTHVQGLFQMVLEPQLQSFAACVMGRIISGKPRSPKDDTTTYQDRVDNDKEEMEKLSTFLRNAQIQMSAQEFAIHADSNYDERNGKCSSCFSCIFADGQHTSTTEALRKKAKKLLGTGALLYCKDSCPWACALLEHLETVILTWGGNGLCPSSHLHGCIARK
jgi:hypothetical protein